MVITCGRMGWDGKKLGVGREAVYKGRGVGFWTSLLVYMYVPTYTREICV